jgi:hypothetical protein
VKPALQQLQAAFGVIPNIAGAMATSPVLINSTDAVNNARTWAVAFHTALALKEELDPADVQALREGLLPKDSKLAALSALAKTMTEKGSCLDDDEFDCFIAACFSKEHALEVIAIVAASTITNSTGSITKPAIVEGSGLCLGRLRRLLGRRWAESIVGAIAAASSIGRGAAPINQAG